MDEEIRALNNAFEIYNLDDRVDLSKDILDYIASRLQDNKGPISQMIEILNVDCSFDDIWNAFEEARLVEDHYKESSIFKKIDPQFVMGIYATPIGNIAVEAESALDIIKYFVMAIKTRNTITISKLDYNEISIESLLLVIFCEALNKFGLSRDLLMIMPFEECFYEFFDETITEENGKSKCDNKPTSNKYIIYVEDDSFNSEIETEKKSLADKGLNFDIISGDFYEVVNKINSIKPLGACIYTKDSNLGYKFINLIHSNNVFVNATLLNVEDFSNNLNMYYLKKKIVYPLLGYDEPKKVETHSESHSSLKAQESNEIKEMSLAPVNANPWYKKIFDAIKKFFKK